MLQAMSCPKCHHNRILQIASVPDRDDTGIRHMHVAQAPNPDTGFFAAAMRTIGRLTAAVCRRCGYTELYTIAPASIPVDGEWVKEIVGPEPEGPYR